MKKDGAEALMHRIKSTLKEDMRLDVVAERLYGSVTRGTTSGASKMLKKVGWATYRVGRNVFITQVDKQTPQTDQTELDARAMLNQLVENHTAQAELIERLQTVIEKMADDAEAMRNTLSSVRMTSTVVRPSVQRALVVYGD